MMEYYLMSFEIPSSNINSIIYLAKYYEEIEYNYEIAKEYYLFGN